MRRHHALLVPLLLLLAACAATPLRPPTPQQADSAGLLLGLKVRVSGIATYRADTVYFVRQCDAAAPDCDGRLLASNFASDGRVYLLNAAPGNYQPVVAAFGSGMPGDNSLYFTYFPAALTTTGSVRVRPGQLAYAGSYVLTASSGVCPDSAEPAQLAFAEKIEPGTPKCGLFKTLLHKIATGDFIFIAGTAYPIGTQTFHYHGTGFQPDPAAGDVTGIARQVQQDLAGSGWEAPLQP